MCALVCLMAERFSCHPAVVSRANDWPLFCGNILAAKDPLTCTASLRTMRKEQHPRVPTMCLPPSYAPTPGNLDSETVQTLSGFIVVLLSVLNTTFRKGEESDFQLL